MKRSLKIEVRIESEKKKSIIDSIRLYRAACRKAYSACAMAEMAGAEIVEDEAKGILVKPCKAAKEILEKAFCVSGKAHLYELRIWLRELHPSWMSIVPESIHREIISPKWRGKDPEFPKATNGYLVLNGARSIARFEHIGIPFKNTVPKIEERSVKIKWDYDIGEINFVLDRLDSARWHAFRNIRDITDGWKLGATYLNEKDGKLSLIITYTAPDKDSIVDKDKTLKIFFNAEAYEMFINCEGPAALQGDKISVYEAVNGLQSMRTIAERYEACRESAGNPRRAWGARKIFNGVQKQIHFLAERRKRYIADRNHLWTRRIINCAKNWQCGTILLVNIPEKELFGHPWNWTGFKFYLNYKAQEIGAEVKEICIAKTAEYFSQPKPQDNVIATSAAVAG